MGRTFIKICGVTRVEDALAAARCGADFVGMILHADSPRTIRLDRAREIVAALPESVSAVGVFVDAPPDEIVQTCHALGLARVQLHGGETPEYVRSLGDVHVWKVLRVDRQLRDAVETWSQQMPDAILLDAAHGGSGAENDWDAIAAARDALSGARFVVAGGLTPANVAPVVRRLRPWAVDVSSGVERDTKGLKSHEKIDAFIRAVRAADESA
jgi:phosphoribosylanthranilate isomerase